MTNLAMWNLVSGFISSIFIIPILMQPKMSKQLRSAVTFLYCVLLGLAVTWLAGNFTVRDLVTSMLLTFVSAIGTYEGLSSKLDITKQIEARTSGGTNLDHLNE